MTNNDRTRSVYVLTGDLARVFGFKFRDKVVKKRIHLKMEHLSNVGNVGSYRNATESLDNADHRNSRAVRVCSGQIHYFVGKVHHLIFKRIGGSPLLVALRCVVNIPTS
jgi:hypothetical protein